MQPLLRWKGNKCYIFWVYVCSLNYPAFKAHMSYYIVICGLSVHNFSMLTRQGHDFQGGGGICWIRNAYFDCFYELRLTFLILRTERDTNINVMKRISELTFQKKKKKKIKYQEDILASRSRSRTEDLKILHSHTKPPPRVHLGLAWWKISPLPQWARQIYIGLHVKCRLFLSGFSSNFHFSTNFWELFLMSKFDENPSSRSWGVSYGGIDRQTDRHVVKKIIVTFSQFYESAQ